MGGNLHNDSRTQVPSALWLYHTRPSKPPLDFLHLTHQHAKRKSKPKISSGVGGQAQKWKTSLSPKFQGPKLIRELQLNHKEGWDEDSGPASLCYMVVCSAESAMTSSHLPHEWVWSSPVRHLGFTALTNGQPQQTSETKKQCGSWPYQSRWTWNSAQTILSPLSMYLRVFSIHS